MRIVVKGKGLEAWSNVVGDCVEFLDGKKLNVKFNFDNFKHQIIIEFNEFETKSIYHLLKKTFGEIE